MTESQERPMALVALMSAYAELSSAWSALWSDQTYDPAGPWVQWRDAEEKNLAWAVLVQAGEMTAGACAQALGAHLDLLSRAYWPDILKPADDPVRYPAAHPPARAVLEAASEMIWIITPTADRAERAMRATELMLWSPGARRRPDKGWHDTARDAGLTVAEIGKPGSKGHQFVHVRPGASKKKALTISEMIRSAFGQHGVNLYGEWSPVAHADPFTLLDRVTLRSGDTGYFVGGEVREDEQVEIAIEVAKVVVDATWCVVGY